MVTSGAVILDVVVSCTPRNTDTNAKFCLNTSSFRNLYSQKWLAKCSLIHCKTIFIVVTCQIVNALMIPWYIESLSKYKIYLLYTIISNLCNIQYFNNKLILQVLAQIVSQFWIPCYIRSLRRQSIYLRYILSLSTKISIV